MTTLSNEIRACRHGVVKNPYQGQDKKVVFVCTMGLLRSATGMRLYAGSLNTRSAGSAPDALTPLTPILIAWADEIVFVNEENHNEAVDRYGPDAWPHARTVILNIPDQYPHMHPKLIEAFEKQYRPVNNPNDKVRAAA